MKIVHDSVDLVGERWHVATTITADDGKSERQLHVFPADTLEWRAAEYGIDPADTATLLDIVLAEPHLTPEDWAAGSRLHDASVGIETARQHHIARCAAAKLRLRMSTRAKASPLERVRAESPMDSEVVQIKAQHVAQAREQLAPQRRAAPGVSRADVLRRQLLGPETVRTMPRPAVVEES